jgi:hypothetical protein
MDVGMSRRLRMMRSRRDVPSRQGSTMLPILVQHLLETVNGWGSTRCRWRDGSD